MANVQANQTLDCKGLSCPMPIVKARKAIETMQKDQVLEVLATDKGAPADFKSWAASAGHELLATEQDGNVYKIYVKKGR